MSQSILFVDSRVNDLHALLVDLPTDIEVHVLNSREDGLLQIKTLLNDRHDIASIQVISHGSSGSLLLGSTSITESTLIHSNQTLAKIAESLSQNADILLYGCNVAEGDKGQHFINRLAEMTSADVAASDNLTGNSQQNGDWSLEVTIGAIEAQAMTFPSYSNTLEIIYGSEEQDLLNGGAGHDELYGEAGNDKIYAHNGDDTLNGGKGDDKLYGMAGEDELNGDAGADELYGHAGDDTLNGGDDADKLYGMTGDDALNGGEGDDELYGYSGDDELNGGPGADKLNGGKGNDIYFVDNINDKIWDTGGYDTVYVNVNNYRVDPSIEKVILVEGTSTLPYFISALIHSDHNWDTSPTYTYSFATAPTGGEKGFEVFSSSQQIIVKQALAKYSDISNVVFIESSTPEEASLRFFRDDLSSAGRETYGGYASEGEIHIKSAHKILPEAILHEIGHIVGFKHPSNYENSTTPIPHLDKAEDNSNTTNMTYNWVNLDENLKPDELRIFDKAAVHYLHGVNPEAKANNDTYYIEDRYIWDGAGIDTVSAKEKTHPVTINLNEGSWIYSGEKESSILADNKAFIGFGTTIENAEGGSGNDVLIGNASHNVLTGNAGDDRLIGGEGLDVAFYTDNASNYTITKNAKEFTISHPEKGTDTLIDIELVQFSDASMVLNVDSNTGKAYRLYKAAFDRTPDQEGLSYWISTLDQGENLNFVAENFINSDEFKQVYGENSTDEVFVKGLYSNVLHREPTEEGLNYWMNHVNDASRNDVLIGFSESNENQLHIIGIHDEFTG